MEEHTKEEHAKEEDTTIMPEEFQNWIISNLFACENNLLTIYQKKRFLKILEDNIKSPHIKNCFKIFYKMKRDVGLLLTP